MTVERVYLCAVSEAFWLQNREFARLAEDALQCERRIAKGINLEMEFGRYTICCQRLEQEVIQSGLVQAIQKASDFEGVWRSGHIPTAAVTHEYLNLLHLAPPESRIGATFFTPQLLQDHWHVFNSWMSERDLTNNLALRQRLHFIQLALQHRCGMVEIQSGYHLPTAAEQQIPPPIMRETDERVKFITIPEFSHSDEVGTGFTSGRKQKMARELRDRILNALRVGDPVAFGSEAQHDIITEVLNDLVFVPANEQPSKPALLRIMYVDGSEAEAFPLFILPRTTPTQPPTVLRSALMSMRHPELDPEIDLCWLRNRDVSRTRTLAETDAYCTSVTTTQLRDVVANAATLIQMYHTGFEPAVIGFYRSVVQALRDPAVRTRLVIAPQYFRGSAGYQQGRLWC